MMRPFSVDELRRIIDAATERDNWRLFALLGAVGAIRQKAVAARAAGETLFLLPQSQSEDEIAEAREIAGSAMRVVTVATLQDALDALADNGGSALL